MRSRKRSNGVSLESSGRTLQWVGTHDVNPRALASPPALPRSSKCSMQRETE
jgi:hypothetical protein